MGKYRRPYTSPFERGRSDAFSKIGVVQDRMRNGELSMQGAYAELCRDLSYRYRPNDPNGQDYWDSYVPVVSDFRDILLNIIDPRD